MKTTLLSLALCVWTVPALAAPRVRHGVGLLDP